MNEMTKVVTRKGFPVKVCPKCNGVHELVVDHYAHKKEAYYYTEFPRIGLYRQVCLKCK